MQRSGLLLFGALFALLFVGVALAIGIGSSTPKLPPGAVAVIEGAPPKIRVVGRKELDGEIAREAAVRGLKPSPQPGDPEYALLKREMLYRLIRAAWFRSEAMRLEVPVTAAQIAARMQPDETKTLRELGFTQAELEERQRWQLVEDNVLELLKERAAGGLEKKEAAAVTGEMQILRDWRFRTYCAEGFITEQCSNFPPFGRESWVPPACYEADPKAPAEGCPAPVLGPRPSLPGSVRVWKPEGDRLAQGVVPSAGGEAEAAGG
ncbi:MAG TPA: hypothetical protein VF504_00565 [Solirubrobacterales bacterium]